MVEIYSTVNLYQACINSLVQIVSRRYLHIKQSVRYKLQSVVIFYRTTSMLLSPITELVVLILIIINKQYVTDHIFVGFLNAAMQMQQPLMGSGGIPGQSLLLTLQMYTTLMCFYTTFYMCTTLLRHSLSRLYCSVIQWLVVLRHVSRNIFK